MTSHSAPSIGLIVVPGTIDGVVEAGDDEDLLVIDRLSADRMAAAVGPDPRWGLVGTTTLSTYSHALDAAVLPQLARLVDEALADPGLDGMVVTHGTNNLEETAYFLSLVVRSPKPVVVTGAMKAWNEPGTDALENLRHAAQLAAHGPRGSVLVSFGGRVLLPLEVCKIAEGDDFRIDSPGWSAETDAVVAGTATLPDTDGLPRFDLTGVETLPRVEIVPAHLGVTTALIHAAIAAEARGIVSMAGGNGVVSPADDEAHDRARVAGVVVVHSSRVACGRVRPHAARRSRDIVASERLSAWKASLLLAAALTRTTDPAEIQSYFTASVIPSRRRGNP